MLRKLFDRKFTFDEAAFLLLGCFALGLILGGIR